MLSHGTRPNQLNKFHKSSVSALESQAAFLLNFNIDYSSSPEAIIWVQQDLLAIAQTLPWTTRKESRAILSWKTILVSTQ